MYLFFLLFFVVSVEMQQEEVENQLKLVLQGLYSARNVPVDFILAHSVVLVDRTRHAFFIIKLNERNLFLPAGGRNSTPKSVADGRKTT